MKYSILEILGYVVLVPVVLALIILLGLYYSWALQILWTWFLVPIGLPNVTIAHMFGIAMFKGLLFAKYAKSDKGEYGEKVTNALVAPLVALSVGYVIHTYFMV